MPALHHQRRYVNTLKSVRFNRAWQILYPLAVYFFLYNIISAVISPYLADTIGQLGCLLISGMVTIIPIFLIYQKLPIVKPEKLISKDTIVSEIIYCILVIAFAIALNVLLTRSGIVTRSEGFAETQQELTDGIFPIKILCNCIVIPVLEELLYRGIIAGQLKLWYGSVVSTILSALFFGMFHFNIVQFLYAFIVGIALGLVYNKTQKLHLCMLIHGIINLIVVCVKF